jgi:hypothetical protein
LDVVVVLWSKSTVDVMVFSSTVSTATSVSKRHGCRTLNAPSAAAAYITKWLNTCTHGAVSSQDSPTAQQSRSRLQNVISLSRTPLLTLSRRIENVTARIVKMQPPDRADMDCQMLYSHDAGKGDKTANIRAVLAG